MDASSSPLLHSTAQQLAALAPFERMALGVLAAAVVPCNRSEWMRQLRDLNVRRPATPSTKAKRQASDVAISTGDLSVLADAASRQGLIVESPLGSNAYRCTPAVRHLLLDAAEARDFLQHMRAVLRRSERPAYLSFDPLPALQAARLALYCRDPAEATRLFAELKTRHRSVPFTLSLYMSLLDPRSPAEALALLPDELRAEYAAQVSAECLSSLYLPAPDMLAALARAASDPETRAAAALLAALSGEPGAAESWLGADASAPSLEARAVLALQAGAVDEARALSVQAWQAARDRRKKSRLSSALAPLLTLLLATGGPEHAALARAQVEQVTHKGRLPFGYVAVAQFLKVSGISPRTNEPADLSQDLEVLCIALVTLFLGEDLAKTFVRDLQRRVERYTSLGAHWLAAELKGVLARAGVEGAAADRRGILADLRQPETPWERTLSVLEGLAPADKPAVPTAVATSSPERRLVFLVRIVSREVTTQDQRTAEAPAEHDRVLESTLMVEPRLQTRRGTGYTAGRAVALKTLFEASGDTDHLTAEDRRVIATIQSAKSYWGGRDYFFSSRVALALVGHPCVFWEDRPEGPAVPVIKQAPRLCARLGEQGFYLRVEPFANAAGIGVMTDGEGRLVVSEQSLSQQNVQRAISELPPVPAAGEARLRQVLGRLSTLFTVESHVGVDAVEKVAPDSRIVLQLARAEPGLRVRIGVAPLGVTGPRFAPAHGPATVAAEIDRKRLSCVRDLTAEQRALAALVEAVPVLGTAGESTLLRLESLGDCLQLLQALASQADAVVVEWPEGTPLAVTGTLDVSSLRLTLEEETSWLTATGELRVDEQRVLELMQVLERRTPDGAFVALGDDRFVALSADLQQGFAALEAAASNTGDALRVAPIALGFVSPWLKLLRAAGNLKANARLTKQLERIEQAYAASYAVPKTFQAELRPYQVTGFEFLSRLGQIGAGACLADDMGLGKTLMTLALLLARAADGPSLIVAPTSVRANWFDEAVRFAPALRMRRAEDLSPAELETLEPFDVLVTSYTLMAQRVEQLERIRFAVLVLDEAQVIKNAATQRARAACRLLADARVALTGTPVENHLGDLFGIMSFLNPGLLGDAKYFETRFGRPIQRERDARARAHLRALIAPFVLRRRKSDVLRELPARTEITLRVEPEAQERAFTEALRRAALERLQASSKAGAAATSTVSILAEITRLRRAACHPHLVDASVDVGAAKLECLVELVHELKEGGHRALVFSQFVDFLKLVRARLEAEQVSFQYLDGSTPEHARRKAVLDFQSGQGDVFLISLKAGGFGLNLTAADYVIHLDPWWNPAVEAQASDRAHRLGQQRPVTIYRLVNAASIEERVLSLHERKQSLAEEILSDSAELTRLDPDALLALLAD